MKFKVVVFQGISIITAGFVVGLTFLSKFDSGILLGLCFSFISGLYLGSLVIKFILQNVYQHYDDRDAKEDHFTSNKFTSIVFTDVTLIIFNLIPAIFWGKSDPISASCLFITGWAAGTLTYQCVMHKIYRTYE